MQSHHRRHYRRFTLNSPLSAGAVLAALAAQIKPPVHSISTSSMGDESYYGSIEEDHFTVERGQALTFGLGQLFFPVATGAVKQTLSGGSDIDVRVRLQEVMESVLAAVAVVAMAAGVVLSLFDFWIGIGVMAIVVLTLWYGFRFHFCVQADTIRRFLSETLDAQDVES